MAHRNKPGRRPSGPSAPPDEGTILVGTWAAATWAIRFYEKHGFQQVTPVKTDRHLRTYWSIPEQQVETSVVLTNAAWPVATPPVNAEM